MKIEFEIVQRAAVPGWTSQVWRAQVSTARSLHFHCPFCFAVAFFWVVTGPCVQTTGDGIVVLLLLPVSTVRWSLLPVSADHDECSTPDFCSDNALCVNTYGSYHCQCQAGYRNHNKKVRETRSTRRPPAWHLCALLLAHLSLSDSTSPPFPFLLPSDINECTEQRGLCGPNATCRNTIGNYSCSCQPGFTSTSGQQNFTANESSCQVLNVILFDTEVASWSMPSRYLLILLQISMSVESRLSHAASVLPDHPYLELVSIIQHSSMAREARQIIAPFTPAPHITDTATFTADAAVRVRRATSPKGQVVLQTEGVVMETDWETAASHGSPGFATVFLITYGDMLSNMEDSLEEDLQRHMDEVYLNSKIATVTVGSRKEGNLARPVNLTFSHLEDSTGYKVVCVYWKSSGGRSYWSKDGCHTTMSNVTHTTCRADHLSSFAVLMALYDIEDIFELKVITWVGLSLSLICLALCILTFFYCRAIQGTRNTIHLHLCISLFIADLVFLAGISSTNNKVGCAVVAGLLHFFFMAAFTWMCLEGIQLYRMVVLVFNTTLRKLYMFAFGYGVPAAIVLISASVKSSGYGTKRHCWLSLDDHFIWSFFGPVCLIIVVNVVFFIITVWKLAEKFTSLNPDMPNLKKVKAFTITAIAQLCILGSMWIFGCFQFEGSSIVMTYLFTILNSVQGIFIFIMHCLLSNQVSRVPRRVPRHTLLWGGLTSGLLMFCRYETSTRTSWPRPST
uniref:Si:ch211-241f5.3 n=1 Tax=Erpetoichthys calabaricus TaxID=27687 RepID=A0A8C4SSN6_ERPCA